MKVQHLLDPLREEPRDARGPADAGNAEQAVYRLGLSALPVPGLPEQMTIGDVDVSFTYGPVRVQRTVMRQRHAVPPVFDKRMERPQLGDREFLTILSIGPVPTPRNFEQAFGRWRAHALAAAGLLTAVLDERVAAEEVFEDAVLFRGGKPVGAADMRGRVRSYLPFDVHTGDRAALTDLAAFPMSERSAATRAARLYRRAVLEGPTADAFALLWMAAECFSTHRSPSRKDIEAALRASGIDPTDLPIHVGLLIDLRGKIQHHGLEETDELRQAYYEMELIVRVLIRQDLGIRGGWWPAPGNTSGFTDPFDEAISGFMGRGTSVWHDDGLPAPKAAEPLRIPRRTVDPLSDRRLQLDPQLGPLAGPIAAIVLDALEWSDPDATLAVRVGQPNECVAASAERILLPEPMLTGNLDTGRLLNLVWDLHSLVGAAVAQQRGQHSSGDGVTAVEAFGAWCQYRRLVTYGRFDPSLLALPRGTDPLSLGKLAGWAAAGDRRARRRIRFLLGRDGKLTRTIAKDLQKTAPGPPTAILSRSS